MGWKYTRRLHRKTLLRAAHEALERLTDSELETVAEDLNDRESTGHPLGFGTNFSVIGEGEEED